MFRKMRRSKQLLDTNFAKEALDRGSSGVLSVHGDDGYPYGVPLSYVYHDDKLYFHVATEGHKLDAIKKNDKVSFCVTLMDNISEKNLTTYFMSVIAFGRARIIEDDDEKRKTITILADRYFPDAKEASQKEIEETFDSFHMIEMKIENLTGKQAIEMVNDGENY